MLIERFKAMYAHRELLFALTGRDIRVRYKQAVMGIAWAFFLPVLAIVSGVVIRIAMAQLRGGTLPPSSEVAEVMVRSVVWLLFAGAVGSCASSLIANIGLVTKIYFPREVLPLAALLGKLFDFSISVVGLVVALIVLSFAAEGQPAVLSLNLLLLAPLLLIVMGMIAGLGLVLSTANVFFRDVKYIVEVLLRFGIFFSGVIVFVSDLPGTFGKLLMLNPLVPLMEAMADIVVRGGISATLWPWLVYSLGFTVLTLVIGFASFQRGEHLFAEYA